VFLVAWVVEVAILISEILFLPKPETTDGVLPYDVVSVALLYGYCLLAPVVLEYLFQRRAMKDILNLHRYGTLQRAVSHALVGDRSWVLKDRDLRREILPFLAEMSLLGVVVNDVIAYWAMITPEPARYAMAIPILIAPFPEEFFFRGYIFRGLIEHDLPPFWKKEEFLKKESIEAMVISTALFVLPHLIGAYYQQILTVEYAIEATAKLIWVSVSSCIVYSWSKDITLPSLLHAFYNDIEWALMLRPL